jgi:hypothetical protein
MEEKTKKTKRPKTTEEKKRADEISAVAKQILAVVDGEPMREEEVRRRVEGHFRLLAEETARTQKKAGADKQIVTVDDFGERSPVGYFREVLATLARTGKVRTTISEDRQHVMVARVIKAKKAVHGQRVERSFASAICGTDADGELFTTTDPEGITCSRCLKRFVEYPQLRLAMQQAFAPSVNESAPGDVG